MTLKFYEYSGCSTCKKAQKFLDAKHIIYKKIAIRDAPPTRTELKKMLSFNEGDTKKLFNVSGQDYRRLNIKDKIKTINATEAIDLLANNGNLIKRPFIIDDTWGAVGFKEDIWQQHFS